MKRNILLTALLFTFISCSNLVQRNEIVSQQNQKSPDGKTYIVISSSSLSRTAQNVINEDTNFGPDQGDSSKLTDLVLTGKKTSAEGEAETLLTAETYAELINQQIMIEPGEWTFTLAGKLNNYLFTGTETKEIIKDEINTLSFTLKSDEKYGSLELTIEWSNTAAKVVGYLYDPDDISKMIASKTASEAAFEEFEEPDKTGATLTKHRTTLTFDKTSAGNKLPSGTYYLKVNFDGPESILNLGSTAYYVTIANGLITKKTITTDLSPTYKLEWNRDGGEFTSGQLIAAGYSRKSVVTLPEISKPGYFFDGWYDNAEFDGNKLTLFSCTQHTGDVTLYAKWRAPVLYVSDYYVYRSFQASSSNPDKIAQDEFVAAGNVLGNDSNDGFSPEAPLKTINGACAKIVELGSPDMDWVIKIAGRISGIPDENSDSIYKDIGRSEIPEDVNETNAKSLTIEGARGLDGNNNPKDIIDRGCLTNGTSSSFKGLCLIVNTTVPVTFKNIKITGGNNNDNSASTSDTYSQKGGGIYIRDGATVSLADGVVIYKNKGYYGGGIYNAGNLYIYGTAIIGNKTQSQMPVDDAANSSGSNGGAIYNIGNAYLGYSYDTTTSSPTEADWTGCLNYNYAWRGGAISNHQGGKLYLRDGTIGHNQTVGSGASGGGAGIYNYGTFEMSGGIIEYNYEGGNMGGAGVCNLQSSSYGTGIFRFTGGKIQNNTAGSGNNGKNAGGGVYNNSIMYIYGDAVIGDKEATEIATAENHSNKAVGEGGGIYVAESGKLYMGYSDYTSETENTPAEWKKGIYYNYSESGGGGLGFAYSSSAVIRMNSGTIANNGATKKGGAAYITCNAFTISGTATIPATKIPKPENPTEDDGTRQSIFYNSGYSLNIDSSLSHISNGEISLIPANNGDTPTGYSTYKPLIQITSAATESGLTIADVKKKFTVEPFTNPKTGIITNWTIDNTGTAMQNASTLYVSANGLDSNNGTSSNTSLPSITAAVAKMDDDAVDYTIILTGEILGTQEISGTVKANSITIKGNSKTARTAVPTDIINANLGETETGSTLTIDTTVPVTLYDITVKGGHGTEKDGKTLGGGLFLSEGATVSIEENTRILQNSATDYGAGVYISNGAKVYVNSSSHITENTGAQCGGGVYIADGGYFRTHQGSGAYITLNTATQGGGVYLDDNATYEMYGCYVRANSVTESGQGSGIFVSGNATFKISGAAEVTNPNDIYLQNNVKVIVVDGVSATLSARLTPQTYPIEGKDDVCLIERTLENDKYLQSWEGISSRFEITPQDIGDGEKQYWYIDKSTSADATGKLVKQSGAGVTVSIPTDIPNDITVTVQVINGELVESGTHFTGGKKFVFTATDGLNSYTWKVDGEELSDTNSLVVDTANWKVGNYVIYLEATDSTGNYYSYTAQIKVSSN